MYTSKPGYSKVDLGRRPQKLDEFSSWSHKDVSRLKENVSVVWNEEGYNRVCSK